ncbi:MAG: peptidylprolyl isomerase [Desulfuromonadales bacterium]|nr:peptidylprolyl isomerase [Desulfuromonadales bacterium]NIR33503.1 peptidylprolyl isomerase [Desulfuromonadales bacterium]NIS43534.1 peptidylprolyl isomerase [Desulfuromonadales bacterium]
MIRADKGDTVTVHYTGRLKDGRVFDASPEDRPLRFIIGKAEVIPGFEEAIAGMYQLEEKTVAIPPEKAYGPREEQYIEEVPLADLPDDLQLTVGGQLEITAQNGDKLLVMVAGLDEKTVTLDGNHPLAGEDLVFDIRLLEVEKAATK